MLPELAITNGVHLPGSDEFIRLLTCSETTLFYPQRGIPFSCILGYSHSHEVIRKARPHALEYGESIDAIEPRENFKIQSERRN